MRRRVMMICGLISIALLLAGCGNGKKTYSTADKKEEKENQDSSETAEAYQQNGFKLNKAEFIGSPEGLGGIPVDGDVVFAVNNVIDGAVTMSTERTNVLVFRAEYEVDKEVSGTLKVVVTDADGNTYTHEKDGEFAASGVNTFEAIIKTKGALSGEYKAEWFIDGALAGQASYTG